MYCHTSLVLQSRIGLSRASPVGLYQISCAVSLRANVLIARDADSAALVPIKVTISGDPLGKRVAILLEVRTMGFIFQSEVQSLVLECGNGGSALPPIMRVAKFALKLGRLTAISKGMQCFSAKTLIFSNSLSANALTTGLSTPVSALLTTKSGHLNPALMTLIAALSARFTAHEESLPEDQAASMGWPARSRRSIEFIARTCGSSSVCCWAIDFSPASCANRSLDLCTPAAGAAMVCVVM